MRSEMEGGAHRPNGGTAEEVQNFDDGSRHKDSERQKQGDTFTRHREDWRARALAAMADHRITTAAFAVAYAISTYFNRQTGLAWPSQETLAKRTGLTDRAVRALAEQLRKFGLLEIIPGTGRGHSTRYRPVTSGERSTEVAHVAPPLAPVAPAEPDKISSDFDEWWPQYPQQSHATKVQTERTYRRAHQRILTGGGSPRETLFLGALRYAQQRADEDPRYTKSPEPSNLLRCARQILWWLPIATTDGTNRHKARSGRMWCGGNHLPRHRRSRNRNHREWVRLCPGRKRKMTAMKVTSPGCGRATNKRRFQNGTRQSPRMAGAAAGLSCSRSSR